MRNTFILFLFLFLSACCFAQQTYRIKGELRDTSSKTSLINATIAVLYAKDSTLCRFSWNTRSTFFKMDSLEAGKYILLVTYPGYADFLENFALDGADKEHDFGQINLTLASKLLEEIIVRSRKAAIKMNGDTTEYDASGFIVKPNDRVEDLLKQLPGIQVDRDGTIKAQGETVSTVLVDGEEFFGDDPTLVTKNIRSDMVDKVQVFDKKSDQAAFTGIDDGVKNKTINIKLKQDKKNGYFGKAEVGGGTDGFYQGQGMLNVFRAKKRVSLYANKANTGRTGQGWNDRSKYGTSNEEIQTGDGGEIYFTYNDQDEMESFDGKYKGEGIPEAISGGIHYDAKWDEDKKAVNTNLKMASQDIDGTKTTISQNNLPGRIITTNTNEDFNRYISQYLMDGVYKLKLDSASNLKLTIRGKTMQNHNTSRFLSSSSLGDGNLLNRNSRNLSNKGDENSFKGSAFYSRKLTKPRRTISISLDGSLARTRSDGLLESSIDFYSSSTQLLDSTQYINQLRYSRGERADLNTSFVYTEPLSKTLSLALSYGLSLNHSRSDRKSFNQSLPGKYDALDTLLSNDFDFKQLSNQAGAVFNYRNGKTIINIGSKIAGVQFTQDDLFNKTTIKRNFININPQARYQFNFSQHKSMGFNYSGRNIQPRIDQIQPVRVNADPLNISVGNPELKPSFASNLGFNYSMYKVLTTFYSYVYGNYNFTTNPIVSNTSVDSAGKAIYQSFNLGSKIPSNFSLSGNINGRIKKGDFRIGLSANVSGNTSFSMINNVVNETKSYTIGSELTLSRSKDKSDYRLTFGPNYNTGQSSLQKEINNNGGGFKANCFVSLSFPAGIKLLSDANFEYRAKTASFDTDFRRLLWNATISKSFLKGENLKLSLSGNDLLKQNTGFNRFAYGSIITQNTFSNISRYFMLSISWDFNKMGISANENDD